MDIRNGVVFGHEPGVSPASDPSLALAEWLATLDPAEQTHEVRTCYSWDRAYELVSQGWQIDKAAWLTRKPDKDGWVLLLSRPKEG